MQQRVCPTCGQPLSDSGLHGARFVEADDLPRRDPRLLLVGAAVVLALLVAISIIAASDGDDAVDGTISESDATPPPSPRPEERVTATRAALRDSLGAVRLAYLGDSEVVVVDTREGNEPVQTFDPEPLEMERLLAGFRGVTLLNDGLLSIGLIGDAEETTVVQLSNRGVVLPQTGQEFSLVTDPHGPEVAVLVGTTAGAFLSPTPLPPGSRRLYVEGVGVLAITPTGETFVARLSGLEEFSPYPVVAATSIHHVEIHCDDPLACEARLVDRRSGSSVSLPPRYTGQDSTMSISPDGRWILFTGGARDELLEVETGEVTVLEPGPKGPPDWLPDASVVIWFDPSTFRPLLRVLDVSTGQVVPFDLSELGGFPRTGEAVVDVG